MIDKVRHESDEDDSPKKLNFADLKNRIGAFHAIGGIKFGPPPIKKSSVESVKKEEELHIEESKTLELSQEEKDRLLEERAKIPLKKPRKNKAILDFE